MMEQNTYEEGSVLMDAEEHFEYDINTTVLERKHSQRLMKKREKESKLTCI